MEKRNGLLFINLCPRELSLFCYDFLKIYKSRKSFLAKMAAKKEVNYILEAPDGMTCGDCIFYMEHQGDYNRGKCFGYSVVVHGTCQFFKKKDL
jgi:hypothetical protein